MEGGLNIPFFEHFSWSKQKPAGAGLCLFVSKDIWGHLVHQKSALNTINKLFFFYLYPQPPGPLKSYDVPVLSIVYGGFFVISTIDAAAIGTATV